MGEAPGAAERGRGPRGIRPPARRASAGRRALVPSLDGANAASLPAGCEGGRSTPDARGAGDLDPLPGAYGFATRAERQSLRCGTSFGSSNVARHRTNGSAGASAGEDPIPGEQRPGVLTLARVCVAEGNVLPEGAKLRSGRAGHGSGEPGANERSAVSLCGGAVWRLRGSHVTVRRPGSSGAKVRRVGESYRDEPLCTAPCSGRMRTCKEAKAREIGHGSPEEESSEGKLHGRERHETRPRSVGASRRAAGSARGPCVPRTRPKPSRGARSLRTALAGSWRPPPHRGSGKPEQRRRRAPGEVALE